MTKLNNKKERIEMATLIGREVYFIERGRLFKGTVESVDYEETPVIATVVDEKLNRMTVNASFLKLTVEDAIKSCELIAKYWQTQADRLREKLDEFVDIGKPEKPGNSHAN